MIHRLNIDEFIFVANIVLKFKYKIIDIVENSRINHIHLHMNLTMKHIDLCFEKCNNAQFMCICLNESYSNVISFMIDEKLMNHFCIDVKLINNRWRFIYQSNHDSMNNFSIVVCESKLLLQIDSSNCRERLSTIWHRALLNMFLKHHFEKNYLFQILINKWFIVVKLMIYWL